MPEEWDEKFAFYAVALCRGGKNQEAALIGCIMFEKAIYHLLKKKGIAEHDIENDKPHNQGVFQFAINEVWRHYAGQYELSVFKQKNDLHTIRKQRNDIIHGYKDIKDIDAEYIKDMILFVWWIYDNSNYLRYNGIINEIKFLTADYTIRDMHRNLYDSEQNLLTDQPDFYGFEIIDFEDLYTLRGKIVFLGLKIRNWISDRQYEVFNKKYQNQLDTDIISRVDTTSAYVWMSLNQLTSKNGRINSASASILGTPLDLRIYFDIGGKAPKLRQDYYEFLKSPSFKDFKEKNDSKDIEIFDVDWYSFIFNRKPLSELTNKDMNERIAKAEKKLANLVNDDSPISWNRLLCGYIIERREIHYNEILEKLDVIIKFYYHFEHFRESQNKTHAQI